MENAARIPLLLAVLVSGGCASQSSTREDPAAQAAGQPAHVRAGPAARDPQLEQRLARLELQLLEKDAQLAELQTRLDDARREVVRGMARTQQLASRAEAASGIAEAEIAVRSLRASGAGPEAPEIADLLKLSTAEFDKQNYGGALYLATQAKTAALTARGQLATGERESLRKGEVPFALPLPLQTAARANVRQGPGNGFAVSFTLDPGTALTGHSFVDQWVRVSDESGRGGWIYQSLIARRL